MPLSSKQTRQLRGLAHHLNPVVMIGDKGITDSVIEKVKVELENHELIKVRVSAERDEVKAAGVSLCEATGAELAGSIGKMLMLYRRRRDGKPTIVLIKE
jgi:RNA-binding protein